MNRVTVLVAIYRARQYIRPKLESLRQQTIFEQATIVLLNCQNLEDEAGLYDSFLRSFDNVVEIRHPAHIGIYASWNTGIRATKSEYVNNSNVDDMLHPQFLEKSLDFLDANPHLAAVSTGVLVTSEPYQLWPDWDYDARLPQFGYPLSTAGPSPVWRRNLHEKYGYFDEYRVIGDATAWERWMAGGEKFGYLPEWLFLYLRSPTSLERRRDEATGKLLHELDREERSHAADQASQQDHAN